MNASENLKEGTKDPKKKLSDAADQVADELRAAFGQQHGSKLGTCELLVGSAQRGGQSGTLLRAIDAHHLVWTRHQRRPEPVRALNSDLAQ